MGYYVLCDPKPAEPSSIKIEMRIADLFKNGHGEAWTDDLCHLEMRVQQSYYFFESMVNEAQKKRDELMDDGKTMTNAFMKKERKLFLAGYDADSKVQIAMGLPGLKARFDAATATITKQDIFEHSMKVQYLLMLPSVMLLMLPTDATQSNSCGRPYPDVFRLQRMNIRGFSTWTILKAAPSPSMWPPWKA